MRSSSWGGAGGLRLRQGAWAGFNGHLALVELILKGGCEANVTDHEGCTAFYAACQQGHLAVAERLADAHPAVDTRRAANDGSTAADVARTKHAAVAGSAPADVATRANYADLLAFLDRIHAVPDDTPLLLRARQRLAWAAALRAGGGLPLSPDLVEHIAAQLSPRAPWRSVWALQPELALWLPCG